MKQQLKVSIGQYSDKGRKQTNQDFHGIVIPQEPQLSSKGIAVALADGISSSDIGHIASQSAVTGFLEDYYCTSDAWSVKKSALRVLNATNSWLHSQTQRGQGRYDKDKGCVCTLSTIVIKSTTAHLFHVGDTRIYRLNDDTLEQLTTDHRVIISPEENYLSRALGINPQLDVDYKNLQITTGDIFLLSTDGVHEEVDEIFIIDAINKDSDDLDIAAKKIVEKAYENGSKDNLTVQIVRIDEIPNQNIGDIYLRLSELPLPPLLEPRMNFDGYNIVREIHSSSRSHVYLAEDEETKEQVVIKTPSIDLQEDEAYLERFLMEEWIAKRISSAHVLKPCSRTRIHNYVYTVTEYIEGQTLAQWMLDNPKPNIESVREIVEQIAKGLGAFHRLEMIHQDLRPENIMIDKTGTVKIIDFGSTLVAGITEIDTPIQQFHIQGTAQYTAPEYFLGELGSIYSDQFSLGVITYQMLCGRLPYGAEVAKTKTKVAQRKLNYQSVLDEDREIPAWVDDAIKKAVHPDPYKRYEALSEFLFDLRKPSRAFLNKTRPPLIERNPVAFWQGVSMILAGIILYLLL
ncbi:MAG: bifunctional protein-serine/threonine kinase/phosphatase [Proteobacteria bacterium]|nr:bifunctional protein-serine/threonine kinase/phosphatase [Pseudomonadota bacterium]NOG59961.1 bifunctional protein-serine/threonine kinase/phosphatase [Pseudomonadota bacterium]